MDNISFAGEAVPDTQVANLEGLSIGHRRRDDGPVAAGGVALEAQQGRA